MREPMLVDVASIPPGVCFTCGSINGPMVDTMCDVPGRGRLYVCLANCLTPWAHLAGLEQPDVERVAQLEATLDDALAELDLRAARLARLEPLWQAALDAARDMVDTNTAAEPAAA